MKASDLRIGNWVDVTVWSWSDYRGYHQITSENIPYIDDRHMYCSPIPLTEEWLIKFGFYEGFGVGLWRIDVTDDGVSMQIDLDGNYEIGDDFKRYSELYYVHQLQNLYFVLTGEELQLSE